MPSPALLSHPNLPARLGLIVLAALCLSNAGFWYSQLHDVIAGLLGPGTSRAIANRDFANYWLAGRLALDGQVMELFAQQTHQAALEQAFGFDRLENRAWSYPPHLILLAMPLGVLPYKAAYVAFLIATGLFFVLAVRRFLASNAMETPQAMVWALLVPFAMFQVLAGQNGFLFGGAMLFALALRRGSPMAAGFMLAILTMKPQLGLLFPLLLLAERNYAAIAWTIVFTLLLTGLSLLVLGAGPWIGFWQQTLPYQQYVATGWNGVFLRMMPTVFGACRAAGMPSDTALVAHLVVAAPVLLAALWGFVRESDAFSRAAVLVLATFLLTPYAFTYDMGPVIVLAALSCLRAGRWFNMTWILALGVASLPLLMPMPFAFEGAPPATRLYLLLPPAILLGVFIAWLRPAHWWPRAELSANSQPAV